MPSELNGIVVVDKPAGITSAGVVARIKRLFGAQKAGHTGTLDPFATGVLICCLNRATRLSRFFLEGSKTYEALLHLGVETDTQDATGSTVARHPIDHITEAMIVETAGRFAGEIAQVPPVYSALKHEGTPLYKLARRGTAIQKPARPVTIERIDVVGVKLPEVRFAVSCSSGTYIRTLCADMGRDLGCGGHLKALRRTRCCGFAIADAVDLEGLERSGEQTVLASTVIGMRDALHFMPETIVDERLSRKIINGIRLLPEDLASVPEVSDRGVFKVIDSDGRLIAVMREPEADGYYNYCCVFSTQG